MADPFIYNDEILALNALNIPDNAVIFDVGCSYGEYTLEVLKKTGDKPITVHCFDAVEDFCVIQRERFKQYPNIKINNFAVSDTKGEASFIKINAPDNQAAGGCSSLWLRPQFIKNNWPYLAIIVQKDTLNNYIQENNIIHIDLMKVDVEGGELAVFKGGSELFQKEMVDIIQFEYNDTFLDAGIKKSDVIAFIANYNYLFGDFISGKYVEITDFVEDYGHHNFYLINKTYFNKL